MARNEAGRYIAQAADLLHSTMYPGDEVRGRRTEVPSDLADDMDEAIRLLNDAEDLLDPGVGQPETEPGLAKLREAASKLGPVQGIFLPTDVSRAREDARNLIARAERAARA